MSQAAALRKSFATVSCPVCDRSVEAPFINAHLDSGCRKYGCSKRSNTNIDRDDAHRYYDSGIRGVGLGAPKRRRVQLPRADTGHARNGPGSPGTETTSTATSGGTASRVFPLFGPPGCSKRPKSASELDAEGEVLKCITPGLLDLPRARVHPITPCGKSWVVHVPRWFSVSADAFNGLWERHPEEHATVVLFGQEVTCSRWNKMYGQDYVFSGQRSSSSGPLSPGNDGCGPELMAAFERVCSLCQRHESAPGEPNGVLVNWYGLCSFVLRLTLWPVSLA